MGPVNLPADAVVTGGVEPEALAGAVVGPDQFAVQRGGAWHRATATRLRAGLLATDRLLAQRGTGLLQVPGDRLEEAADTDLFHVQRGGSPFQVSGQRVRDWLQQFTSARTLVIAGWGGAFVMGGPAGSTMQAGETGTASAFTISGAPLPEGSLWRFIITESSLSINPLPAVYATGEEFAVDSGGQVDLSIDIPADLADGARVTLMLESVALRERYIGNQFTVVGAAPSGRLWTPADLSPPPIYWFDFTDAANNTLVGDSITQTVNKGTRGGPARQATAMLQPLQTTPANGVLGANVFADNGGRFVRWLVADNPFSSGAVLWGATVLTGMTFGQNRRWETIQSVGQGGNLDPSMFAQAVRFEWGGVSQRINGTVQSVPERTNLPGTGVDNLPYIVANPSAITVNLTGIRSMLIGTILSEHNQPDYGPGGGIVHEVVTLDRDPSLDEIQRIEGYFAHRPELASLGLVARLPADHPYRNTPPMTEDVPPAP